MTKQGRLSKKAPLNRNPAARWPCLEDGDGVRMLHQRVIGHDLDPTRPIECAVEYVIPPRVRHVESRGAERVVDGEAVGPLDPVRAEDNHRRGRAVHRRASDARGHRRPVRPEQVAGNFFILF